MDPGASALDYAGQFLKLKRLLEARLWRLLQQRLYEPSAALSLQPFRMQNTGSPNATIVPTVPAREEIIQDPHTVSSREALSSPEASLAIGRAAVPSVTTFDDIVDDADPEYASTISQTPDVQQILDWEAYADFAEDTSEDELDLSPFEEVFECNQYCSDTSEIGENSTIMEDLEMQELDIAMVRMPSRSCFPSSVGRGSILDGSRRDIRATREPNHDADVSTPSSFYVEEAPSPIWGRSQSGQFLGWTQHEVGSSPIVESSNLSNEDSHCRRVSPYQESEGEFSQLQEGAVVTRCPSPCDLSSRSAELMEIVEDTLQQPRYLAKDMWHDHDYKEDEAELSEMGELPSSLSTADSMASGSDMSLSMM